MASTGVIGEPLPIEKIEAGIRDAAVVSPGRRGNAAEAIMTTDTAPKEYALKFSLGDGQAITIGGIAKGSGMIHPNMATMLSFLTTDAASTGRPWTPPCAMPPTAPIMPSPSTGTPAPTTWW